MQIRKASTKRPARITSGRSLKRLRLDRASSVGSFSAGGNDLESGDEGIVNDDADDKTDDGDLDGDLLEINNLELLSLSQKSVLPSPPVEQFPHPLMVAARHAGSSGDGGNARKFLAEDEASISAMSALSRKIEVSFSPGDVAGSFDHQNYNHGCGHNLTLNNHILGELHKEHLSRLSTKRQYSGVKSSLKSIGSNPSLLVREQTPISKVAGVKIDAAATGIHHHHQKVHAMITAASGYNHAGHGKQNSGVCAGFHDDEEASFGNLSHRERAASALATSNKVIAIAKANNPRSITVETPANKWKRRVNLPSHSSLY